MHFVQLRSHCKLHKPRQKHTNQFKITVHTKIHIKTMTFLGITVMFVYFYLD